MLVKLLRLVTTLAAYLVFTNTALSADRTSSILSIDDATIVVANALSHTISFILIGCG